MTSFAASWRCKTRASSDRLQIFLGFLPLGEQAFFHLKLAGMDAAPASADLDWMLQMQHLVIKQILHRITRRSLPVENAAHHNRVVRGIVVAEAPLGGVAAPGKQRPAH